MNAAATLWPSASNPRDDLLPLVAISYRQAGSSQPPSRRGEPNAPSLIRQGAPQVTSSPAKRVSSRAVGEQSERTSSRFREIHQGLRLKKLLAVFNETTTPPWRTKFSKPSPLGRPLNSIVEGQEAAVAEIEPVIRLQLPVLHVDINLFPHRG